MKAELKWKGWARSAATAAWWAPAAAMGVVAHLGGAAPDREGRDQARQASEAGRGQEARGLDDLAFGGRGGAQERRQPPRLGAPDRQHDDRLLVVDRALPA
ncbi:MAG TPA: hypothetical protein VF731_06515 [Solirubrobacterales bacterium]